jgi:hypothetical protein
MRTQVNTIRRSWHYPRPDLAQLYLTAFDLGLNSARGLFARRRMGKTEFLQKDLAPLAAAQGFLVAYANFWEDKSAPESALVSAIARALEPTGFEAVLARLKAPLKKVKASGRVPGGIEGAIEAELSVKQTVAAPVLREVLTLFDKQNKRLLLLLDEAQILARAEHSDFAHALRAALDTRKESIKVIFAGSAEATLREMFARSSEPFYNWAPVEPFPLLGDDFVVYCTEQVNMLAREVLNIDDARAAFSELGQTPEFFRRFLERYVLYQHEGFSAALEHTKAAVYSDVQFARTWSERNEADRVVLIMLAQGKQDLHGADGLAALSVALGKRVDRNIPANALKRLRDDMIVSRLAHGEYRIEDEGLAEWIRRQAALGRT